MRKNSDPHADEYDGHGFGALDLSQTTPKENKTTSKIIRVLSYGKDVTRPRTGETVNEMNY